MYEELIEKLHSSTPNVREEAAESIRDIYENEFQYKKPPVELVGLFVEGLIGPILAEKEEDIQCQMLDALYVWSWFPYDESSNLKLSENIHMLLSDRNIGRALQILIASGSNAYKTVYEKYLNDKAVFLRKIASDGLQSIEG